MKKIFAILLVIALMASVSVTAFATGTGNLSATTSNATPAVNSEVEIKVSMANCGNCKSIALVFDYSDDIFELVEGTWALSGTLMANYDSNTKAAAAAYTSAANANGNNIFTLKLKVKSDAAVGEQTITITPTVNLDTTSIPCEGTSVTLNIGDSGNGNQSADVTAKYNASTPADVYSVDITWGAMEFDYNAGGQKWDADAHKYVADEKASAAWAVNNSSNTITLKNNSSKAVDATFAFSADTGYTGITGGFTYNTQALSEALTLAKPAEDTAATEYVVSFMPSGELVSTHSSSSYAKIGSITVTLG